MKKRSSPRDAIAEGPCSPPLAKAVVRAAVDAIGAQGDGVAMVEGRKTYIPFTLPGETVRVALAGGKSEAVAIESASPDRVPPFCTHFGVCGGCSLQHWREPPYADWKAGLVREALGQEGLDAAVEPLQT